MKKPITLRDCLAWLWDKTWPILFCVAFYAVVALGSTEWW